MTGGYLLYKCRRCGQVEASIHAPDALVALVCIIGNMPMPSTWLGTPAPTMFDLHSCADGGNGCADLIGIQKDEEKRKS